MGIHLRITGCCLPYGITQCYLPHDTRGVPRRQPHRRQAWRPCPLWKLSP